MKFSRAGGWWNKKDKEREAERSGKCVFILTIYELVSLITSYILFKKLLHLLLFFQVRLVSSVRVETACH